MHRALQMSFQPKSCKLSELYSPVRQPITKMITYIFFVFRGEFFVYDTKNDFPPSVFPRVWRRQKFHYDNVPIAMLTLFAVQTTEGWPV